MKKIILILYLSSIFFSCEQKKVEQVELERYSNPLERNGTKKYCENLKDSNLSPKLNNPINLAVSKDGETVYVINSVCNRHTFSNSFFTRCIQYFFP